MVPVNSERFFANRECPYFPCHGGAQAENFNCLFCYCPLYCLGRECGGNFSYTASGVKDCSACLLPHTDGGYDYILKKYPEILKAMKEKEGDENARE